MKITTLTYQAVKNTGNYESKRLEATANLDEGEDPNAAFKLLQQWVHLKLEAPVLEKIAQANATNSEDYPF